MPSGSGATYLEDASITRLLREYRPGNDSVYLRYHFGVVSSQI